MSTVIRRNHNSIISLKSENNQLLMSQKEIGDSMLHYFGQLLCTSNPSIPFDPARLISPVINGANLALIDSTPSSEEFLITLKSMGSNKSPRPDGLPVLFFKEYWSIIGWEVISTVQDFLQWRSNVGGSKSHFYCPYSEC